MLIIEAFLERSLAGTALLVQPQRQVFIPGGKSLLQVLKSLLGDLLHPRGRVGGNLGLGLGFRV